MMAEGCQARLGCTALATVVAVDDIDRNLEVRVVRVFTRDGQGGNHLGIHQGLLPDADMQDVARELAYSETIFVDRPDDDGVVPVRIFTPSAELPFAGHPLVGAAWFLAAPGASAQVRCGIGVVTGHRADDDSASIEVTYLPPVERTVVPGTVAAWIADMPLPYEVHRLGSPEAVAAYRLDDEPDHRLVWALGEGGASDMVRARFFAAGLGVAEDPATGSAAVALAAVLRHEGTGSGALTIHQGAEIGSPSRIDLTWTASDTLIGGAVADDGSRSISARRGS
jgi:trans-2,3-dihydro-3-hydroxyanthranilate isomerase